jgi:hypothetical protein
MTDSTGPHLEALEARYNDDLTAIRIAADEARAAIDGDTNALTSFASNGVRSTLLADVPIDDLPAYVPPPPLAAEHALIPDTPLIDGSLANTSLAFDDAPLWQN